MKKYIVPWECDLKCPQLVQVFRELPDRILIPQMNPSNRQRKPDIQIMNIITRQLDSYPCLSVRNVKEINLALVYIVNLYTQRPLTHKYLDFTHRTAQNISLLRNHETVYFFIVMAKIHTVRLSLLIKYETDLDLHQ